MNKINELFRIIATSGLIIVMSMMSIIMVWIYTDFTTIFKAIFTIMFAYAIYDIFKVFIHTRWILWKTK